MDDSCVFSVVGEQNEELMEGEARDERHINFSGLFYWNLRITC